MFDNTFTHFTFIVLVIHLYRLYFHTAFDIFWRTLLSNSVWRVQSSTYTFTHFTFIQCWTYTSTHFTFTQCSNSSILPSTKIKIPINFLYDSVCLITKNSPKFSRLLSCFFPALLVILSWIQLVLQLLNNTELNNKCDYNCDGQIFISFGISAVHIVFRSK